MDALTERDEISCADVLVRGLALTTAGVREIAEAAPSSRGQISMELATGGFVAWAWRDGRHGYGRARWRWLAEGRAVRMLRDDLRVHQKETPC